MSKSGRASGLRVYFRFTSRRPSASTISLDGSPRVSILRFPTALLSRHTMTREPL
ncbi:hypothetical protein EV216_104112 [Rhodovulum steppense]|uniref:Uncharacterized protein n=1 Tax=Rhodovulum steppense TaxID=540251 RepID=A0A4R1YZ41_9RHOB|nr:hypothetical protein EV216_104112 [Rhodovulum steppense]